MVCPSRIGPLPGTMDLVAPTQCQRFLPGRNPRSLRRFLILWAGEVEPFTGRQ